MVVPRWDAKDLCLPKGGPGRPSNPPANTDCPFNWSWYSGKGCCAPHQPPNTLPPPQCANGWSWSPASLHCNPPPTPPTGPKQPSPSRVPAKPDCDDDKDGKGKDNKGNDDGGRGGNGHRKRTDANKRQHRSRNISPCPKGLSACPVSSLIGGDYECVDTLGDLDNCGGCATLGEGQNCNAIPGVWNVGCEQSVCKSEWFFIHWLHADLTIRETSLYVCRRLYPFQGRKVLPSSLNLPVVRFTASDLDFRWWQPSLLPS